MEMDRIKNYYIPSNNLTWVSGVTGDRKMMGNSFGKNFCLILSYISNAECLACEALTLYTSVSNTTTSMDDLSAAVKADLS